MSEQSEYVFVYGTLKQGHGNNRLLQGCEYLGPYKTELGFQMYDCGFPVVFPEQTGRPVLGEVYRLPKTKPEDVIARLDRLEAEGYMYKRWKTRAITLDGSRVVTPFMYMGVPDYWHGRDRMRYITPDENGLLVWGRDSHI